MYHLAYSAYYFISCSYYAYVLGFFPLYCKQLGFTPWQIAAISAAGTVANIVAGPWALQLSHSSWSARRVLAIFSALALTLYVPLFWVVTFPLFISLIFCSQVAKRGAEAIVDAQAVRETAAKRIRFEHSRLWGSIGFVVALAAIGEIVDYAGTSIVLPCGLGALSLAYLMTFIMRRFVPDLPGKERLQPVALGEAEWTKRTQFWALIVSASCCWASHAVMYVYLSLYLEALGWSGSKISAAWNIGVLAEVVLMIYFPRLEKRFSLERIYQFSLGATVLRWALLYWTADPWLILASQLLHAFSFGGCYVGSVRLVYQLLPESKKDRGQGYLSAASAGVGSLIGRGLAGLGASHLVSYAEVNELFLQACIAAALGFVVSLWLRPAPKDDNKGKLEIAGSGQQIAGGGE